MVAFTLRLYAKIHMILGMFLKRNSKKLAVDPARREPGEALRAEFEGSMGKLLPLRERIRQTDELIDGARL